MQDTAFILGHVNSPPNTSSKSFEIKVTFS